MADFNKLQEQIDAVRDAADEAERNLGELDRQGDTPERETFEYLRGDAHELDQRVERLTQNLRAAADEAEEIIDPEPAPSL